MNDLKFYLEEYAQSHQNNINIFLHKICVPLIVFSLLGILWGVSFLIAVLAGFLILFFYFNLSKKLFFYMLLYDFLNLIIIFLSYKYVGDAVLYIMLLVFFLAWVGQFIGHMIEGKRPSFSQDIKFLLIGPIWVFWPKLKKYINY